MNQWWECPNCGAKVDFTDQMYDVFDNNGEANFVVDKNCGLYFHTIECNSCDAIWVVSISGMYDEKIQVQEGSLCNNLK